MFKKRYIEEKIGQDLRKKMVFIGGPRQVGKTTLSRLIGEDNYVRYTYLNWDNPEERKKILSGQFDPQSTLIIFDEIRKYAKWKSYIKGQYDAYHDRFNILVTGSARLDLYQRGGDSLMGRYYYYRLHPFSQAEVSNTGLFAGEPFSEPVFQANNDLTEQFQRLLKFGGFPEPFFENNEETLRRWHNQRIERLVKEDIRDTENIRNLSLLQVLLELLPSRIGSPLSINALREDLQVAHKTMVSWLDILERFYYHFRVYPFADTAIKSLKKEAKLYLWDWSQAPSEAARLENMVASHLLKFCHFLYDARGYKAELSYIRDRDQREVDFLVTVDRKPWMAIEVKTSDIAVSKPLVYFSGKLDIPFRYQVVSQSGVDFIQNGVRVMSADLFLSGLV